MESSSSSCPPSSLSLSLRRLMSLDGPRVALGRRCDVVKEELSEDPMPLAPPVSIIEVKAKKKSNDDPPPSRRLCCVLCTSRPGDDHLEEFCSPDIRRLCHLRSLLGSIVEDADLTLVFCAVCRHAVNRLFALREEVAEIESRIRAVGTLRGPIIIAIAIQVKLEDIDSASDSTSAMPANEVDCGGEEDILSSSVLQEPTTTTPIIPNDQQGRDDRETEEPSCDLAKATEGTPALKASGARGKGKNQSHVKKARNVEVATSPRMSPFKMGRHIYCPVCQKGFYSKEIYKSHSHPDKKDLSKVSYTCQLCQKNFERTKSLRNHKRVVHLKLTQKVCRHCGKRFQTKYNLRHHNITCNPQNQEGQRKCHCGKVFTTKEEILAHERVVHKGLDPIKCYFCTKMFSKAAILVKHMRIHTLERPYLCGKCGKDFAAVCNFRRHMATVCGSDEKKKEEIRRLSREYLKLRRAKLLCRCDLCDIGFGQKKSLIRHQRRQHK